MTGICDTCRREHCHTRMDCVLKCDFYKGGETRYDRLFGTPERAARTLYYDKEPICAGCALMDECKKIPDEEHDTCLLVDYDALLGWLRGDAE